jgi:hypothetical protein
MIEAAHADATAHSLGEAIAFCPRIAMLSQTQGIAAGQLFSK